MTYVDRKVGRPPASTPAALQRMKATRQRDTAAELVLRSALHARGFRYRVHRTIKGVPRVRPDIVFATQKLAIFVDGCFWHACPQHGSYPKENADWWRAKLLANVERDRRHDAALRKAGWAVLRAWEHEGPQDVAERIAKLLRSSRSVTK